MLDLVVPKKLQKGDKVAAVSLSWGGAGDENILWRYYAGKKRLEEEFGLHVVEMPHTLDGTDILYQNPQYRAQDLMDAFKDDSIKAIFTTIGGDDGIRLLPYIDFDVIRKHPKVFIGYSDITVHHFMCLKAGVRSYYGPSILVEFAENGSMDSYTKQSVLKTLFSTKQIGKIPNSTTWTSDKISWDESYKEIVRKLKPNSGTIVLQGTGTVTGPLIGGCIDVLEMIKGTTIWPSLEQFDKAILFLEPSEEHPSPMYLRYWLRNYGAIGLLNKISAIIVGKPNDEKFIEEYKTVFTSVISDEFFLPNLPIIYNLNFGHTSPMFVIPFGAVMTIDIDKKSIMIDEPGVK